MKAASLKVGWKVAVVLKEPLSGTHCLVGRVLHMGETGLELVLIDWFSSRFDGDQMWIPWTNILGVNVGGCLNANSDQFRAWDPARFQEHVDNTREKNSVATALSTIGRRLEHVAAAIAISGDRSGDGPRLQALARLYHRDN